MRFMMSIIPTGYEQVPSPASQEALVSYSRELHRAGVLLTIDGQRSAIAPENDLRSNDGLSGSWIESRFWILQVNSKQEAMRWASRCPASRSEIIEVRPLHDTGELAEPAHRAI